MIGQTISHYRIHHLLGAGAMGEVYLAEDTELGRRVALKILPAGVAGDPERIRRFKQEAKAASALNHPNILTVYEIGQFQGTHFMVSEYIKGEDLRQCQSREPLNLREALEVAIQLATGLNAAHEAGIIHRDIKPENIMRREDGLVKVLDFGLAKLIQVNPLEVDRDAPTIYKSTPGMIIGTVAYMSPEQARGKEIDARSDVWGMGICLYEMLTGRLPFFEETVSDTIASILKSDLPPLDGNVPDELSRIVRKALQKDRDSRYQTMKDFLLDLKTFKHDLEFAEDLERSKSPPLKKAVALSAKNVPSKRAFLIAMALLLVGLIVAGIWYRQRSANLDARQRAMQTQQLYEAGRALLKERKKEPIKQAKEKFEQAIANDPDHALSYVGLADTYALMEEYVGLSSRETLPIAEENARKALRLNSSLAEAYASLGFIKTKQWKWLEAREAFERAIKLDPRYAVARQWYTIYLRNVGDYEGALKQITMASDDKQADPIVRVNIVITYLVMGNLKKAEEEAIALKADFPEFWGGRSWLGMVHLEQGHKDEAILSLDVGMERASKSHTLLANLGYGAAVAGRNDKVSEVLAALKILYDAKEATGQDFAKVYAGLGRMDEAFEWLEKDFQARSGDLPYITWHPAFKSLRKDPRYVDLLRRMELLPKTINSQ